MRNIIFGPPGTGKTTHLLRIVETELKKYDLDAAQVCLSYPMSLPEVDRIVIGVNNADQLKKLIKLSKSKILNHDLSFMISNDNLLINPSNWENM